MLSVKCPRCESKYQLDAAMRGKKMRCPNTICRAVFEVRDDADPPAVVEAAKEAPRPIEVPPPEPVTRKPIPKPVEAAPVADFPDDFPGDDGASPAPAAPAIATEAWQPETPDAPPVRDVAAPVARPKRKIAEPAPRKRRWALWLIVAMFLTLGLLAGAAFWRIRGGMAANEADRFQKAEALHKEQRFADAATAFQNLQRDFPDSVHIKKYRFLAELSDVRDAVASSKSAEETNTALSRVLQFAGAHHDEPLLKERSAELWQMYDALAGELTRIAGQDKAPDLLPRARQAWEAAKAHAPSGTNPAERERELTAEWTRIEQILALHAERQHVIATLRKLAERTNAAAVQEGQALVEKAKKQDDKEIQALLNDLVNAHRAQVKFGPPPETPALEQDALPSLSVTPALTSREGKQPDKSKDIVLALARGVLYALAPGDGELRWARRVGIDTTVLPLRMPANATTPERLLVLSSDERSVSAVVAQTGATLWQTRLSEACPGRPVLVDQKLLVPTLAGRIDEIDTADGKSTGSYQVGQALTLGGVHQSGTPLVYFPADEFCLYVIDVSKRTCTNILYTKHPAGSLRGLPSIAPSDKGGVLLWTQARGSDRVEIKPYELPIAQSEQKPAEPIVSLPRLSSPPWVGPDRLAAATQTGFLSVWGIQQKGTRDPLLFPLLKQDVPIDEGTHTTRCQVVKADAENYWTIFRGNLQRVQSTFDPKAGPGLLQRWTKPTPLGTPLHEAQLSREADGRSILYVTTQADDHATCLCSAVDAEDGTIIWQRQLGAVPLQAPIVHDSMIYVADAHGLLAFTPGDNPDVPWRQDGVRVFQQPWTGAARRLHVRAGNYVQLSWQPSGKDLQIRKGTLAGGPGKALDVRLTAPMRGTPALGDGYLLLPTASGIIERVDLETGEKTKGADWRASGAEDQALGHLVALAAGDYLLTDGSRGLERHGAKKAETKLPHRLTGPPVLLKAADDGKTRLCVADASDTLTLLDADRLTEIRSWAMPGRITSGPFVRSIKIDDKVIERIGCVVAKNRLVWLDPEKAEIAWAYEFADIVGEPHVIDGALIIADVAGRFVALDAESGRPRGAVLTLKANVAAAASPLQFGPGQAFVPLTDGTILVLPLSKLGAAR